MSDKDTLGKAVFETHMSYLKQDMSDVKSHITRIFVKLDEHNSVLVKNTESLILHERRSTNLEKVQKEYIRTLKDISLAMNNMSNEISRVSQKVDDLEADILPVKNQVNSMQNIVNVLNLFYDNRYLIIKFIILAAIILAAALNIDLSPLRLK